MKKKYLTVSVIVNVYNEEKIITECLQRVRDQDYPQDKIDIILVDDNSTDNTVAIAKRFRIKVVKSGYKNIERAKSIGIEHARGELILFLDADVLLYSPKWISQANTLFQKYPAITAVQSIRWHYSKADSLATRYCNLFGINDPFIYFLKKRGALMATEEDWPYKKTIVEKQHNYFIASFTVGTLPTMGAQGYIIRRKRVFEASWKPYFFHLDTTYELVEKGYTMFALSKLAIRHVYVSSIYEFYAKLYRNITLFLTLHAHRKYTYKVSKIQFLFTLLLMMSIVYPLWQSCKGYIKIHDKAWFLHPLFSFTVPVLYTFIVLKYKISTVKLY